MPTQKQKNVVFFFVIAGIVLFLSASMVQAITISPLRQTVTVDPGSEQMVRLQVKNDSGEALNLLPQVEAFTTDNEGRPRFGVADEAVKWIKADRESLRLAAGVSGVILFTVAVPAAAEPGAHYLGLFAAAQPSAGEIGLGARVGSILFLHVAGAVEEAVVKENFSVARQWNWREPIGVNLRLKNVGTIHVIPAGELQIIGWDDAARQRLLLNAARRKILPGLSWSTTFNLDNLDWRFVGPVRVAVYIRYGLGNRVMADEISFWYVPWWAASGGFLIVGIICAVFVWQFRKRWKK